MPAGTPRGPERGFFQGLTLAINFAKSCLEHGNKKDAKKVLEKILKIIPDSEEIKDIVKRLDSKNDG